MSRPSEKASGIAEELLDYVHPGMSRAAATDEIARMVDELNAELMDVVMALLAAVEKDGPGPHAVLLNHLREISSNYKPLATDADAQHELFSPATDTQTGSARALVGKAA